VSVMDGRIGGMITGGAGGEGEKDITYATSINCIMESIKKQFHTAHLYPYSDRNEDNKY